MNSIGPFIPRACGAKGCSHSGNKFCFCYRGIKFYGGGSTTGYDIQAVDLIVSLSSPPSQLEFFGFTPKKLQQFVKPCIYLPIQDGGVPRQSKDFWLTLWEEIDSMKPRPRKILVHCLVGHGRTGTVLAVLVGLLLKEEQPIHFVRNTVCKECVETQSQIDYVEKITGHKENVTPSMLVAATQTKNTFNWQQNYPKTTAGQAVVKYYAFCLCSQCSKEDGVCICVGCPRNESCSLQTACVHSQHCDCDLCNTTMECACEKCKHIGVCQRSFGCPCSLDASMNRPCVAKVG